MYRLEPRETYDRFIIGVATWKPSFPQAIVYDQDALIEHLAHTFRENDPELDEDQAFIDAQEHFNFNIAGGSGFYSAPIYVSRSEYDMVLEEEEAEREETERRAKEATKDEE